MQRIYNIKTGEHLDLWPIDAREIVGKNSEWSDQPTPKAIEEEVIEHEDKPKRGRKAKG